MLIGAMERQVRSRRKKVEKGCLDSDTARVARTERKEEGIARRLVRGLLAVAPGVWCMPGRRSPGSRSVF